MRASFTAGLALGVLVGAGAAGPVMADDTPGTVSINFDKQAWAAITSEVVVTATGRAEPIGQCCPCGPPRAQTQINACCACTEESAANGATCETAGVAARSFTMPAVMRGHNAISLKGGLALTRDDASVRIENVRIDLARKNVTARVEGPGPRRELFRLSNVKRGAWVKAHLGLARGEAARLNEELKADVFTPRMQFGQLAYTSD